MKYDVTTLASFWYLPIYLQKALNVHKQFGSEQVKNNRFK